MTGQAPRRPGCQTARVAGEPEGRSPDGPGDSDLPAEDVSRLATAIETGAAYNVHLGVRAESIGRSRVVASLPDAAYLHNHVGGPHAGALFSVAESAAALMSGVVFGDLVGEYVLLVKDAQIHYRKLLRGTPYAEARFTGDEGAVRAALAENGRASFTIDVTIRDAAGTETGSMTATMALRAVATL